MTNLNPNPKQAHIRAFLEEGKTAITYLNRVLTLAAKHDIYNLEALEMALEAITALKEIGESSRWTSTIQPVSKEMITHIVDRFVGYDWTLNPVEDEQLADGGSHES